MDIFTYALKQYAVLALMCVSFWGAGSSLIHALTEHKIEDGWLAVALSTTVGLGSFILLLQILGATGYLQRGPINIVLFSGLLLAAWQAKVLMPGIGGRWTYGFNPWALLAIGAALTLIFRPLVIPLGWDALMYHLPHASQWAKSGHLSVSEWIRYPWFPYNFDLLYAAALILRHDSFAHLLHALAGWLTMLLIYRLGARHGSHLLAFLASSIWIYLSQWFYSTAYIELGISLFVFASCISFHQWLDRKEDEGWLLIACFLFGVAVGSKYQVLSFLPLFFIAVLVHRARSKLLLKASFFFLAPCIYWYLRNYLLTGDPFNPLGGKIFGYSDWNAADMEYQLFDISQLKNWPDYALWPAVIAPLFFIIKKNTSVWYGLVFSIYSFVIWYVTSHYDRYLMPAFPVIALLSAYSLCSIFDLLKIAPNKHAIKINLAFKYFAFFVSVIYFDSIVKQEYETHKSLIAYSATSKEEALNKAIPEIGIMNYLKNKPELKVYQWGLEGLIYYFPHQVRGDHFGKWRYRDFVSYSPEYLAQKLKAGGFDVLVTNSLAAQGLEGVGNFKQFFEEIAASNGAKAYRIIQH